jgi:hypothetical protein
MRHHACSFVTLSRASMNARTFATAISCIGGSWVEGKERVKRRDGVNQREEDGKDGGEGGERGEGRRWNV